jgi:hypothetical protein
VNERRKRRRGDDVRYALMMIVALIASYAAYQAYTASHQAHSAAKGANVAARRAEALAVQVGKVAVQAGTAAAQATALAAQVQAQRKASIERSCEDQNARHDRTIRALDYVIALALRHRGLSRARRIEIQAGRASSTYMISALAPKQDCAALVAATTGS